MKAIILAAGVGRRIQAHTASPKCLLQFDGSSLLARHLDQLQRYPVSEAIIVTGHMESEIQHELARLRPALKVTTAFNEQYCSGSVVSLHTACQNIVGQDPMIIMDADVLYHYDILDTLINSRYENALLLDRNFETGDEPVKICVKNNKIVEFRKQLATGFDYDFMGESVGFFKFSADMIQRLAIQTKTYIDQGKIDEPYEEVIRDLLLDTPESFGYEDITGIPWLEIDFPEDVTKARQQVLPAISKHNESV